MRTHYDFAAIKPKKNPYPKLLKQSVTIRLDRQAVDYFKSLAASTGLPYQSLINLYLRDCAERKATLNVEWTPAPGDSASRAAKRRV